MDWEDILKVRDKSQEKLQEFLELQRRGQGKGITSAIEQKRKEQELEPRFKDLERLEEGLETLVAPITREIKDKDGKSIKETVKNPFPTPSLSETQKRRSDIRPIEPNELKILNKKSLWKVNRKVRIIFERTLEEIKTSNPSFTPKYDVRDLSHASLFLMMLSKIDLNLPPPTMDGKKGSKYKPTITESKIPFTSLESVDKYLKDIDKSIKEIEKQISVSLGKTVDISEDSDILQLLNQVRADKDDDEIKQLKLKIENLKTLKHTIKTLSEKTIPTLKKDKEKIEQEKDKNKKEEARKSYRLYWRKTMNIVDTTIDALESNFGSNYFQNLITSTKQTPPSTTINTYFPDSKKNKQTRLLDMLKSEKYVMEVGKNNKFIMKEDDLKKLIEKLDNIRFNPNQNFAFLQPKYQKRKKGKKYSIYGATVESNPQYNPLFKSPNKALESTLDILNILGGKYFSKQRKVRTKEDKKKYTKTVSNNRLIRRLLDDWSDKTLEEVKSRVRAVEQIGLLEPKNVTRINKILFRGNVDNFFVKDEHPFINYDSGFRNNLKPQWDEDKNSWGTTDSDGDWEDRIILYDNKKSTDIWREIVTKLNLSESGLEVSSTRKERKDSESKSLKLISEILQASDKLKNVKTRQQILSKYKKLKEVILTPNKNSLSPSDKNIAISQLKNEDRLISDMYSFMTTFDDVLELMEENIPSDSATLREALLEGEENWAVGVTGRLQGTNRILVSFIEPLEFLYQILFSLGRTVDIEDSDIFQIIKNQKMDLDISEQLKEISELEKRLKEQKIDTEKIEEYEKLLETQKKSIEIFKNTDFVRNQDVENGIEELLERDDMVKKSYEFEELTLDEQIAKALRKVKRKKALLERSL